MNTPLIAFDEELADWDDDIISGALDGDDAADIVYAITQGNEIADIRYVCAFIREAAATRLLEVTEAKTISDLLSLMDLWLDGMTPGQWYDHGERLKAVHPELATTIMAAAHKTIAAIDAIQWEANGASWYAVVDDYLYMREALPSSTVHRIELDLVATEDELQDDQLDQYLQGAVGRDHLPLGFIAASDAQWKMLGDD